MAPGGFVDQKKEKHMTLLISGVLAWALIHLVPAALPGMRNALVAKAGEKPYRGIFSLLILASLVMIVIGWRSSPPAAVYTPPAWGATLAFMLMFLAVVLFGASHAKTNIKRIVRHPQLTSVLLWSVAHLAANGDSRSMILFGGLGVWALIEMSLINRRDGKWVKPERAAMKSEMIGATISVVVFLVLIALHPYFAGVSPLPPA
jgi:uncharacterized membrane protein